MRKLYALIARCHQMLGDLPAALSACSEGLRIDPDDAEIHFRKAVLHRKAGQPAEAEAFRLWKMVLDACPRDTQAMARGDASH